MDDATYIISTNYSLPGFPVIFVQMALRTQPQIRTFFPPENDFEVKKFPSQERTLLKERRKEEGGRRRRDWGKSQGKKKSLGKSFLYSNLESQAAIRKAGSQWEESHDSFEGLDESQTANRSASRRWKPDFLAFTSVQ